MGENIYSLHLKVEVKTKNFISLYHVSYLVLALKNLSEQNTSANINIERVFVLQFMRNKTIHS